MIARLTSIPLVIALLLMLAGCGGGDELDVRGLLDDGLGFVGVEIPCEPTCDLVTPDPGQILQGDVLITVIVDDEEGDEVSLALFFRVGSGDLQPAVILGATEGELGETTGCHPANPGIRGVTNIDTSEGPIEVILNWDSQAAGVGLVQTQEVSFAVVVEDCSTVIIGGDYNDACTVEGIFVVNNDSPVGQFLNAPQVGAQLDGTIPLALDYEVVDGDSSLIECTFDWTTDNGTTWNLATPMVGQNPSRSPPGQGTFEWSVATDIDPASLPVDVVVRKSIDDLVGRPTLPAAFTEEFTLVPPVMAGPPSCTIVQVTDATIDFDLADPDTALVTAQFELSTDGGTTWQMMTPGAVSTNPQMFAPGTGLSWQWDSATDVPTCTAGALVRMTVDDLVMMPNRPATCTSTPTDVRCP